ncbi:MAG: hypothetical protein JWN56_836 [Sphingobacteriales bacterium]|nr:hypothetical protein [Sphingobacteriales bacterium]
MEVNYPIVILITALIIWLIIFLILKNQKDKKKLEKQMNLSDLEPEKHKKEDKI